MDETLFYYELAESENDANTLNITEKQLLQLHGEVQKKRLECLLNDEADHCDAYIEFHAGAGGTESQDWAIMLFRMYSRWAEHKNYRVETVLWTTGEETGIRAAILKIIGHNAFGWLKTESGVHRLVRISPFDSNARRHTSFTSIWVYPVIDDSIEIDLKESECKIDTYRASGAGGQHVNTTDSAVRITHLPTGIISACQQERSQHKNRQQAWVMLRAKLYEHEKKKRDEQLLNVEKTKTDIGWGHQIRSYVLHPYQLVKDLRTGIESTNPQGVLDGDLNPFLEASLAQNLGHIYNSKK